MLIRKNARHTPSRGDRMDTVHVPEMMNAPVSTQQSNSYDIRNSLTSAPQMDMSPEPMPANALGVGAIF